MPPSISLLDIPDELIQRIVHFVPPEDNLLCTQRLSRRLQRLSCDRLLWRSHCRDSFRYWHPDHHIDAKFSRRSATDVQWCELWVLRRRRNATAEDQLEGLIGSRVGQASRFKAICMLGYDVKDYFLEQTRTEDGAEDVLARRYYANRALDAIHRAVAIQHWVEYIGRDHDSPRDLEKCLGGFDMFVLHDQEQDLDWIGRQLDRVAAQFRDAHATFDEMTTREKGLALNVWLRVRNLVGMDNPNVSYRNARNCLIGHALSDPNHDSLPIISSAIYCCVSERLGLDSMCCLLPGHVHVAVKAPPNQTLDGDSLPPGHAARDLEEAVCMFLNPYGSDHEVTRSSMRAGLVGLGFQNPDLFIQLGPVSLTMVRTANNLLETYRLTSVHALRIEHSRLRAALSYRPSISRLRAGLPESNMESLRWAAQWAELLMYDTAAPDWPRVRDAFLDRLMTRWNEDAWLVEKCIISHRPHMQWGQVHDMLSALARRDASVACPVRRTGSPPPASGKSWLGRLADTMQSPVGAVYFRVGQVLRHKKYGYLAIIDGWTRTLKDESGPPRVPSTGEDDLEHSATRVYYTCLGPGSPHLRVAQENVEIVNDPNLVDEALMFLAGRSFRRFDRKTCTFVSNVRELYPDD